jgi:hypothetical protein
MNYLNIEKQLYQLQKACNRSSDPLANWVLYAISRHINTGRSTKAFDDAFCKLSDKQLDSLIIKCLNGDKSDNGIMKTVNKIIRT